MQNNLEWCKKKLVKFLYSILSRLGVIEKSSPFRQIPPSRLNRVKDTFPARFPNIFVDYPLGQMHVGNKLWTNWNKAPMQLLQSMLNFAVWCTSSACGVSSEHLYYTKHLMIRAVYRFHTYYHVR